MRKHASAGGLQLDPSDTDLRSFTALRQMRDAALGASAFDAFERWLIKRKPLCETAFFKAAGLCPPPLPPWEGGKGEARDAGAAQQDSAAPGAGRQALAAEDDRRPALHEKNADVSTSSPAAPVAVQTTSKRAEPTRVAVNAPTPAVIPVGRRAAGGETVELATSSACPRIARSWQAPGTDFPRYHAAPSARSGYRSSSADHKLPVNRTSGSHT